MRYPRMSGFLRNSLAAFVVVVLVPAAVSAVPIVEVPAVANRVFLRLVSDADGRVVQPGETISWSVHVRVAGPNRGLALISLDLMQDVANPSFINLDRGFGPPAGMAAFDVPAGFTNPGPEPTFSGYGGTPLVAATGGSNLVQVGGAQNTFGVPGPCRGAGGTVCAGQDVSVSRDIGRGPGQLVATGEFPAPAVSGRYRFVLAGIRVSVLGRPAVPPAATPVHRAISILEESEFSIQVQGEDAPFSAGIPFAVGVPAARVGMDVDAVLRPADGARVNRTHVRFWWPAVAGADTYTLEIVVDDDSDDPFAQGEVMTHQVSGDEPRVVVTQGLEFGKAYVWRVAGATGVHRFTTISLPPGLEPFPVTRIFPGDLEPGVTLINIGPLDQPTLLPGALSLAVDEDGDLVYFHQRNSTGQGRTGYVELQSTGRLLMLRTPTATEGADLAVFEETLDGRITWASPADRDYLPHHDVQLMPSGDLLFLLQDDMFRPEDEGRRRRGDRIVVLDRLTRDELWSWRTAEHYPFASGDMPINRWSHGNAAFYYPPHDSVYFSSRHFSRITRIDFATGDIIFNMGKEWPAGDTDFGHEFFTFQHAPELQPDGHLVIFDNGNLRTPRQTRVVEIEFDDPLFPTDAAVVRQDWLVDESGEPLFVSFAGDADRQPNGNTLVMAGAINRIQELGPDGKLLWNLSLRQGEELFRSYRAQRVATMVRDTPGDRDGDWDVDLADLAGLQAGYARVGLGFPDRLSDFNGDDRLDATDLEALIKWMTGPVE